MGGASSMRRVWAIAALGACAVLAVAAAVAPAAAAPADSALAALRAPLVESLQRGDLAAARAAAAEAVRRCEETFPAGQARDAALADLLQDLGTLCYRLGDHRAAAAAWERTAALLALHAPPDHRRLAWVESDLAEMRRLAGDIDAAENLLRRACERAAAHLPRDAFQATFLINLGALCWDLSRFDETERLYRQALAMCEGDAGAEPIVTATARLNLGVLLRDQGRLAAAEPLLRSALEQARRAVPGDARLAYFLSELGKLHEITDRWREAILAWEEALAVLARQPAPQEIYRAQILLDTARARLARGETEPAQRLLREALALRERALGAEHPEVGVALAALAECLARREGERSPAARRTVDRALALLAASRAAPEARAEALALRARLEMAGGRATAARADLAQALAVVEELRAQRGGGDQARLRFLQRFLVQHHTMISWLVAAGETEEALRYAERIRGRLLRDQLGVTRHELWRGLDPQQRSPLERRERRARARIAGLQREIAALRMAVTADDTGGVRRLARLEREREDALGELREVDADLKLLSPTWRRALGDPAAGLTVARLQEGLLRSGEALLLYHIGPEASHLFYLPDAPGRLACHPLRLQPEDAAALGVAPGPLSAGDLESLLTGSAAGAPAATAQGLLAALRGVAGVAPLRPGGAPPGVEPAQEGSERLFRVLAPPPLWRDLAQVRAVIIIPDGALHLLPFEALVTSLGEPGRPARFWLDDGPAIRYGPAAATLLELAERSHRRREAADGDGRVVSICDPVFAGVDAGQRSPPASVGEDAWDRDAGAGAPASRLRGATAALARLPGTRRESEAIRRAFPPGAVTVLAGSEATEGGLRRAASAARYLHLATHGLVDPQQDELLAALALTPVDEGAASDDDGLLHLFEIGDLRLACDLVVLSACETSLGRALDGEGVFALASGFLSAGARRAVATLWAVDDASAAALMEVFFRRVAEAEQAGSAPDFAVLLRDAKRQLREQPRWSSPLHWAPFVLSGAP